MQSNDEESWEPRVIDGSRSKRIARGAGRPEREVKELVNQYFTMKKMMKQMKRRGPMMGIGRAGGMPILNKKR